MKLEEAAKLVEKILKVETESGEGLTEAKLVMNDGEWEIVLDSREISRQVLEAISPLLSNKLGFTFQEYNEMRIYTYEK